MSRLPWQTHLLLAALALVLLLGLVVLAAQVGVIDAAYAAPVLGLGSVVGGFAALDAYRQLRLSANNPLDLLPSILRRQAEVDMKALKLADQEQYVVWLLLRRLEERAHQGRRAA